MYRPEKQRRKDKEAIEGKQRSSENLTMNGNFKKLIYKLNKNGTQESIDKILFDCQLTYGAKVSAQICFFISKSSIARQLISEESSKRDVLKIKMNKLHMVLYQQFS